MNPAWLGLLLVLLLALGSALPAVGSGAAAPSVTAVALERRADPRRAVSAPPVVVVAAAVWNEVRLPGRARSVLARGLPPARAPTA